MIARNPWLSLYRGFVYMFSCWSSKNKKGTAWVSLDLRARNQNSLPAVQLDWFIGCNTNHGSRAEPSASTAVTFRQEVAGPFLIHCSWNQTCNYKITKRNSFIHRTSALKNYHVSFNYQHYCHISACESNDNASALKFFAFGTMKPLELSTDR